MKKNILLVHSLLILPLISSSCILTMDQKTLATVQVENHKGNAKTPSKKRSKRKPKEVPALLPKEANKVEDSSNIATEPLNETIDQEKTALMKKRAENDLARIDAIKARVESDSTDQVKADAQKDLETAKKRLKDNPSLGLLLSAINSACMNHALKSIPKRVEKTKLQEQTVDMNEIKITVTEDLEKSSMVPAQYSGFSYTERARYALYTNRQVVIDLLKKGIFEPNNAAHTTCFNLALEECAEYNDIDSLAGILTMCQTTEKYTGLQSAINHVGPVFNFLCDEYKKQISSSNNTLAMYNEDCIKEMNENSQALKKAMKELLEKHRDTVTIIAQNYEKAVTEERKKVQELHSVISQLGALNILVKNKENALYFYFQLDVPKNSVRAIEEDTHRNVRHLFTRGNMPQAQSPILHIDNK